MSAGAANGFPETAVNTRGRTISMAVQAIEFARRRRSWFRAEDFAKELECCKNTAFRWLIALEANGIVTRCGTKSGGYRWRRVA